MLTLKVHFGNTLNTSLNTLKTLKNLFYKVKNSLKAS